MDKNHFEIELSGAKVIIQSHDLSGTVIFRVIYPNKRPPLVITHSTREAGNKFWTSIPEGRQHEAEEIGELITKHFKTNP